MKIVTPRDWRAQPWRNGGGVTHEILRRSARGDVDDYDLRLSLAEVARSGPFSTFRGYRRWSFLADAAPIHLRTDSVGAARPASAGLASTLAHGTAIELVARGDHVELPGDVVLAARLPAGPTHLFNILARVPLVAGFGPCAHPVAYVFALAPRPDLGRWCLRVLDAPAIADTTDCVWIATEP